VTLEVIAIDGPAASGKTSTAAAVARALGAHHLDSGALYRGLTRVALDEGTDDPDVILRAAGARGLELRLEGAEIAPFLDGRPAEPLIRTQEVTVAVSRIAAIVELRAWVNERLRAAATPDRLLVLDGRDIGTAVFPQARLKVFLVATAEARARRRLLQRATLASVGAEQAAAVTDHAVAAEARALRARDEQDATRPVVPLRQAADAVEVDTTHMTLEQQVNVIAGLARHALGRSRP